MNSFKPFWCDGRNFGGQRQPLKKGKTKHEKKIVFHKTCSFNIKIKVAVDTNKNALNMTTFLVNLFTFVFQIIVYVSCHWSHERNRYDGERIRQYWELEQWIQKRSHLHFVQSVGRLWEIGAFSRSRREGQANCYQMGLDSRADLQLVPFLLQFLDEVDEHVCLWQVLREQDKIILPVL